MLHLNLNHRRITIRNAEKEDAPILARWWNDGSVMAHAGFPLGLGTTAEKIAADLIVDNDCTRRRLMLLLDQEPIGEMSYRFTDPQTADIGIKICESSYQEQGIGRVALSMLISALFSMGCKQITLDTNLKNTRAQHVYEKLGFQKTAVHYDSWKNQLGNPESAVDYCLIPENFHNFAV